MQHASVQYKDLSFLIGEPLIYGGGIPLDVLPDGEVKIIKEYPNTVLLEMTFIKSYWGQRIPPRKHRHLVPKASLMCGAVNLKRKCNGMQITGNVVTDYIYAEGKK